MGFRERRAARQAQEHAAAEALATATLRQALSVLQGRTPVPSGLALRRGERVLWSTAGGGLFESRSAGGHWEGRSRGISIPVGDTRMRVRLGQSRGHYVRDPEQPTEIDRGTVLVTTQRVVFQGVRRTQEWLFAKLVGITHDTDAPWTAIQVANRQKVSGVIYPKDRTIQFRTMLEVGVSTGAASIDDAIAALEMELGEDEDGDGPSAIAVPQPAAPAPPARPGPARAGRKAPGAATAEPTERSVLLAALGAGLGELEHRKDMLAKLAELRDAGLLSEEEYAAKAMLLASAEAAVPDSAASEGVADEGATDEGAADAGGRISPLAAATSEAAAPDSAVGNGDVGNEDVTNEDAADPAASRVTAPALNAGTDMDEAEGTEATASGPSVAPAGWYPDPAGRAEQRWWDGAEWTPWIADGGVRRQDNTLGG